MGLEKPPILREKRDKLYERIGEKIDIIKELRFFVMENTNLPPDEFEEKCIKKMKIIENIYDEEIIDGLNKLKEAIVDYNAMYEKYLEDEGIDQETQAALKKIGDEISEFKLNNDIQFLERMRDFFDNVIEKRKEVVRLEELYSEDREKFFSEVELERTITSQALIEFSGCDVFITLPPEIYEKEFDKNSNGTCIHESPISFIKDKEGKEETKQHESNHNLSESFVGCVMYKEDFFHLIKECINRLNRLKKVSAPDSIIKSAEELIARRVRDYYSQNNSEIIADIDRIMEGKINTYFVNFSKTYSNMYDFIESAEDGKGKDILKKEVINMRKKFIAFMEELSDICYMANKFDATEDAKAALILFKSDQLRKVSDFLKNKIGENKYDFYRAFRLLLKKFYFKDTLPTLEECISARSRSNMEGSIRCELLTYEIAYELDFFRSDNIRKVRKMVEKDDFSFSDEDKERLENISPKDPYKLFDIDESLRDLQNFKKLLDDIKVISDKLSISSFQKFAQGSLVYFFFSYHLIFFLSS